MLKKNIEITGGQGWIFNPLDLTNYEGGKYQIIATAEAGDGISRTGGKCWARFTWVEDGKFNPEDRTLPLPPGQGYNFTRPFDRPMLLQVGLLSACKPELKNKIELSLYVSNTKPLSCNPPGANSAIDPKSKNARDNGKIFKIATPQVDQKLDSIIFVNGIDSDLNEAKSFAMSISQITQSPTELVYNSSSKDIAISLAAKKFNYSSTSTINKFEAVQRKEIANWAKNNALHNPPTAQALASLISQKLSQGKPVNIVAYSQGAAILAEALKRVDKCSQPNTLNQNIKNIRVLSIAGAADRTDFPKEINISSFAHKSDFIAMVFGENRKVFDSLSTVEKLMILRNTTQHTNYLGQDVKSIDIEAQEWLKRWAKGNNFKFQLLNDAARIPL